MLVKSLVCVTVLAGLVVSGSALSDDSAFSNTSAVDFSGNIGSPNFYCVNNNLCTYYNVQQSQSNVSVSTWQAKGGCLGGYTTFYVSLPQKLPTNTTGIRCGFQPSGYSSFCRCSAYPRTKWPFMGIHVYCDAGGGANACYGWFSHDWYAFADDDDDDDLELLDKPSTRQNTIDPLEAKAMDEFFAAHPDLPRPTPDPTLGLTSPTTSDETFYSPNPNLRGSTDTPTTTTTTTTTTTNTTDPTIVWMPLSNPLRDRRLLVGRDASPSSPPHNLATKTLVDSPWAVAVGSSTDQIYYTDIGGRIIRLDVPKGDAEVVLDMNMTDDDVMTSLSFHKDVLYFSHHRSLYSATLDPTTGHANTPTTMYTCAANCSNLVFDPTLDTFYFAEKVDGTMGRVMGLKNKAKTASTLVSNVRFARETIIPIAVDAANNRLFFADWVFGIQMEALSASDPTMAVGAGKRLTVAEPDGPALHVVCEPEAGKLTWLNLVGHLASRTIPVPATPAPHNPVAASRRLRLLESPSGGEEDDVDMEGVLTDTDTDNHSHRLGRRPRPTKRTFVAWNGTYAGSMRLNIYSVFNSTVNTVLYGPWYRNFVNGGALQFDAGNCQSLSLQYPGNPNGFADSALVEEPIPAYLPAKTLWQAHPVWTNTPVTAFVSSEREGKEYRAQSLSSNDNGILEVTRHGQELRVVCTDEGRGIYGNLYSVDPETQDVYYVGVHAYLHSSVVYHWDRATDVYTPRKSFPNSVNAIVYDPTSKYVFVAGNTGSLGWVGRFQRDDGSTWERIYSDPAVQPVWVSSMAVDTNGKLFVVAGMSSSNVLMSMNLDGSANKTIVPNNQFNGNQAGQGPLVAASPDTNELLYLSGAFALSTTDLLAVGKDGSNLRELTLVPFLWPGGMFPDPNSDEVFILDYWYIGGARIIKMSYDAVGSPAITTRFDNVLATVKPSDTIIPNLALFWSTNTMVFTAIRGNYPAQHSELWRCDTAGTTPVQLAPKLPTTCPVSVSTVNVEAGTAFCQYNIPLSMYQSNVGLAMYDIKSNTTTQIGPVFDSGSRAFELLYRSEDGTTLWYSNSTIVEAPNGNGVQSQVRFTKCSVKDCAGTGELVVNVTAPFYEPGSLAMDEAGGRAWFLGDYGMNGADSVVEMDLNAGTWRNWTVSVPNSHSRAAANHLAYDSKRDQLLVSTSSSDGSAHYSVCELPIPPKATHSVDVGRAVISSFTPTGFAVDWTTRTVYVQMASLFQPTTVAGNMLAYDLDSGNKTLIPVDTRNTSFGVNNQAGLQYVGAPTNRVYYNQYSGALVSFNTDGTDGDIMLDPVTARPNRLYYDRPAQRMAWPDKMDNGTEVLRWCITNDTSKTNGTSNDLRTSKGHVLPGRSAMAVHNSYTYNAFPNGSLYATDFQTSLTELVVASPLLVNATDMDIDRETDTLYIGTAGGDIVTVDVSGVRGVRGGGEEDVDGDVEEGGVSPVVWQSGVPGGVFRVFATLNLDQCFP